MKRNLLDEIPAELSEELISVLVENDRIKLERITSDGHVSPAGFWYDQNQDEWVLLVSGSAVLSVKRKSGIERVELGPGDHLLIPAHQPHRVEETSSIEKTIWIAVYYENDALSG